ncbi:surfactin synthase thioesterase subunit [Anaerocolumna cellulosilytica]|uniref:Surfactin synthase thioesterase subunit n=1 Tax=Anaerocolumna cellulosilytica TaxID=433286 RepID=A0A6S6QXF1_9FIRM|nr:alpha/beta fold hydrolase [Anaerocolumna cellulosilytica]MBB5196472.1 external thioesterase TEII [Anaerocolumna cellulosilytica]BCJ94406.1 surfactin synthase thioesterase subunit [Anaerocolumna cellulosilytica]
MNQTKQEYVFLNKGIGLRRLKGKSNDKTKIFFFPFVGGQSLSYKDVAKDLPENMEVLAIDYPGHGWVRGEYITDFDELVMLLYEELEEYFGDDFYFFGHSLGGLIAYRMVQYLERKNRGPQKVFISASPLPHRIEEYRYLADKSIEELVTVMSAFGGINPVLLENKAHLEYFAAPMKADIAVFLKTSVDMNLAVETPMYVFYSEGDSFVKYTDICEWGIYGQTVVFIKVKGEHIFIQTDYKEVTEHLNRLL